MYYFLIHTGMPGYLPNDTSAYIAQTAAGAVAFMDEAMRTRGIVNAVPINTQNAVLTSPDASMWNFTLATFPDSEETLSVQGLTKDEFGEWSGDACRSSQ